MFGEPYDLILIIVGLIYVGLFALGVLSYIWRLLRRQCPPNLIKKYGAGSWAVVTGGSDGIGRGFAEQLAKRGFNLVLVARNKSKLDKVASEVGALNQNISIKTVAVDFSKAAEPGFFDSLYDELKELNISILVNNVGVDMIGHFHQSDEAFLKTMISVNCFPNVLLTRKLINHFRSRTQRSAVINVSSTASIVPMPFIGTYGSTKVFEDHLSRSLQIEYPDIDFISLRPGFVSTNMTLHKEIAMDTISAEDCAEGCLRELGRYERTSSHIKHDLLAGTMSVVPAFILNFVSKNIALPKEMERRKEAEESHKQK